jgi:hypothetical protein
MEQITKELTDGRVSIEGYRYELPKGRLENPDTIRNVRVTLPNGLTAKFIRAENWSSLPLSKVQ